MDSERPVQPWADAKLIQLQFLVPCYWASVHRLEHSADGLFEVRSGCRKVLRYLDGQAEELDGGVPQEGELLA